MEIRNKVCNREMKVFLFLMIFVFFALRTPSTVLQEKRGRLPSCEGYLPRFRYVFVLGVYRFILRRKHSMVFSMRQQMVIGP